jgi:hypothetical protein
MEMVTSKDNSSAAELDKLILHLEKSFPLTFSNLKREDLGCHTVFLKWEGSDPSLKVIVNVV